MIEEEIKNKIIEKEIKKTLIKKIKQFIVPILYWLALISLSGFLTYTLLK